ncbi:protein of unknown function DUF4378 [Cynara cardunculus var. scolymus]|uniref:DUF4378 domain-containing protein n=1 Tax=Cynara cardunculus var. scolymus TaxID=59895 RepID=A0A118K1P0_CYNCS|nr:protein of unknown function DUF4378 [Cynara cardunculus var. scolymus]
MMNETASLNGSSSLAISDKRPRKTGGCVGIFFQLFDWNRRFAKKKLFSKRLLPPDRAKEASKKFGGDEKLPKLRLIADENSGGFPNINKNGGSSGNSNVGKNGVQTPSLVARLMGLESMPSVHREKLQKDFSGEFRGGRREKVVGNDDDFEKETSKQDFRPQKLQKTGMVERRSVTRFGAEALQLKNVLSRSRKHHHHHHHHPKLASPVKNTSHHARRNSSRLIGAATRILEPQSRNRVKHAITYPHSERIPLGNELGSESMKGQNLDLLNGQTSCKNCGNLVDVSESTSKREVRASILDSIELSSQVSPNCNSRFNQEKEFSTNIDRGRQPHPQNLAFPAYFKENSRRTADVSLSGDGGTFSSQSRSNCLRSATVSVSDTKDFVALNRSLSGRTRSRTPSKVEDTKFDKRGKFENGQKRPINHIRIQSESCGMIGSSSNRPRTVSNTESTGGGGNKNCDGMAFRFNSSMNKRCEIPTKLERRRIQNGSSYKTTPRKKSTSNQIDEKICLQKPYPLTGDSLGAILEEKLKELANQVGYESKRSSANIFQELICALKERPIPQNNSEFSSRGNHLSRHQNHRHDQNTSFGLQAKSEKTGGLIGYKIRTQHADSLGYSYDESRFLDLETDPFLYAGVKEDDLYDLVADLLTYIVEVLSNILDAGVKGNKRAHITETIFNAELVLGNQMAQKPNETNSFLVCRLLLELETVAEVMWMKFGDFLGSENPKAGYQMKLVAFDCLIEYLDLKYGKYSKCGFRVWTTVPPFMGPEILVHEVVEEVRRWMGFVGRRSDELVEVDMSHWLGKWTDFEIEGYEIGARIEGDVLEMLVDEIVVDLCCCCSGVK